MRFASRWSEVRSFLARSWAGQILLGAGRDRSLIGEGALIGAAAVTVLMVADLTARSLHMTALPWLDRAIPLVANMVPRAILWIYAASRVVAPWVAAAVLVGIAALFAWPRTRRAAVAFAAVFIRILVAFGCAAVLVLGYTVHWWVALGSIAAAVPMAFLLARQDGLHLRSMGFLAAGLAWAMVYPLASADDRFQLVQPVPEYLAVGAAVVVGAWFLSKVARFRAVRSRRRLLVLWALSAVSLGTALFTFTFGWELRARDPSANLVVDAGAYDLAIVGAPPQLVWADKTDIFAMTGAYGGERHRYRLDYGVANYPQRIWPSALGGFFVQERGALSWWPSPQPYLPLSPEAAFRYSLPVVGATEIAPSPYGVVEDMDRRRLFVVGEWFSEYAFLDIETGKTLDVGQLPGGTWPYWQVTFDPVRRVVLLSSCAEDGGVLELDLDTGGVVRKASNLFAYRIVPDPGADRAWAVRPSSGELLSLDPKDFRIRDRQHLGWGLRELERDPKTGDMYTCTMLQGDVFRVDSQTGQVEPMGRCGRFCRHLVIDSDRRSLWAATRDGICRFDLP